MQSTSYADKIGMISQPLLRVHSDNLAARSLGKVLSGTMSEGETIVSGALGTGLSNDCTPHVARNLHPFLT